MTDEQAKEIINKFESLAIQLSILRSMDAKARAETYWHAIEIIKEVIGDE